MPGKMVKSWPKYEALRRKGYSKTSAAKITNAGVRRKKSSSGKRRKSSIRRRRY